MQMISDKASLVTALRLYLVTDERDDTEQLMHIVREAIQGGVTAVQLRRKNELGRRFVEIGRQLRQITAQAGVMFIVNDRVDVACLVEADGVHLGQDDINCRDARMLLPDKLIGISADTVADAVQAQKDGADYLGVGSLFPTISKPDATYCTLEDMRVIKEHVSIPIVGIGGIKHDNARSVIAAGADGIAVVSAITAAADPKASAVRLKQEVSI